MKQRGLRIRIFDVYRGFAVFFIKHHHGGFWLHAIGDGRSGKKHTNSRAP
ncbi:hypothetical protein LRS56_27620 [Pseudomonas poae]|nr:hypothetical protein LRS56_27620 [Pseudomonas poae]